MNTWKPKYLHKVSDRVRYLDHRLVPEVRAMFAAMMSRVPRGGIEARYREVVKATAAELYERRKNIHPDVNQDDPIWIWKAEERLTEYPLETCVQGFFDKFVGQYGHASIKELTGSPCVFIEDISWWAAYLSFDNPLVRGQEMSTRAVWRRNWPMAQEVPEKLREMHELGLEIAWHDTEAWKTELRSVCELCEGESRVRCSACHHTGKKYPWINDPQAFRPAFDRARWALPGTISTGVSHCADIRTMGRVISQMEALATNQDARDLVEEIKEGYRQALPGLAGMWLRESTHATKAAVPYHLKYLSMEEHSALRVEVSVSVDEDGWEHLPVRTSRRSYVDPIYNQVGHISFSIPCSLAASRDWHRHRSAMPWEIRVVLKDNSIQIDPHYAPISEYGKANYERYIELCSGLYKRHVDAGDSWGAMLCLPLGTRVQMEAQAGLRDFIYITELRGYTHGANFEYQEQARELLAGLKELLHPEIWDNLGLNLEF